MFGRDARDVPAEGTYTDRGTGPHGVITGVGTNTTATHPTNNRGVLGAVKDAAETVKDKTLETTDEIGHRIRGNPGYNDSREARTAYGTTPGAHVHGTTDNYGVNHTTGTHAYSREHATTPTATGTFGTVHTYDTGHTYGPGHTYSNEPGVYGANTNIEDRRTLGQQAKDAAANVGQKTRDAVDVVAEKMHR